MIFYVLIYFAVNRMQFYRDSSLTKNFISTNRIPLLNSLKIIFSVQFYFIICIFSDSFIYRMYGKNPISMIFCRFDKSFINQIKTIKLQIRRNGVGKIRTKNPYRISLFPLKFCILNWRQFRLIFQRYFDWFKNSNRQTKSTNVQAIINLRSTYNIIYEEVRINMNSL